MKALRPMSQIYKDAEEVARAIVNRANNVFARLDKEDKEMRRSMTDIAWGAQRFANKAARASCDLPAMKDDGSLRAYCELMDRTFDIFVKNAAGWEVELTRLEKKLEPRED